MNIANIQTVIKDVLAKKHSGEGVIGLSTNSVVRKWEHVKPDRMDDAVKYLRLYTSEINDTTQSGSVTDLIIDKSTLSGVWRGGAVTQRREDDGNYTIFQELHEGLVQSIDVQFAFKATTADGNPDIDGLRFYDSGIEVNSQIVYYGENRAYALWTYGGKRIISLIDDVGGTPANYFEETVTPGTFTGIGTWTGTVTVAVNSETANDYSEFIVEDGAIWKVDISQVVLKLPNVDPASEEDIRLALKLVSTFTDLQIKYETISGTYFYTNTRPIPEQDGSLSILLTISNSEDIEYQSEDSASEQVDRIRHPNITDPENVAYDPPARSQGEFWMKRVQSNGNGTWDIVYALTTVKNQQTISHERTAGTTRTVTSNTAAAAQIAAPVSSVQGKAVVVTNRPTKEGMFGTVNDERVRAVLDTGQVAFNTKYGAGWVRTISNSTTSTGGITMPTSGYNNTFRSSKNDDGTFEIFALAVPEAFDYSTSVKYTEYAPTAIAIAKPQYRTNGSVNEERTVNLTLHVGGKRDAGDALAVVVGCFDVTWSPNSTGTFFQVKGYKKVSVTGWGEIAPV